MRSGNRDAGRIAEYATKPSLQQSGGGAGSSNSNSSTTSSSNSTGNSTGSGDVELVVAGVLRVTGGSAWSGNTAPGGGGAVFADGFFEVELTAGATFSGNRVTGSGGGGGAIALNRFPPRLVMAAATFDSNSVSDGSGGAVSIEVVSGGTTVCMGHRVRGGNAHGALRRRVLNP